MKIERVRKIYDEICEYSITLAPDPTAYGVRYLHDQTATCRNYLNAVTAIMMEIHREKHNLAHELAGAETLYALESNQLLSNDERVRKLPSIDDRMAAISVLLRDHVAKIAEFRRQIQDLDFVEKAVKHRHRELKDTMGEIKLQRSLLRDEIDTRSFYGDERAKDGSAGIGEDNADDLSADEIASLMADERAAQAAEPEPEVEAAAQAVEPEVEAPPPVVSEPDVPTTDTASSEPVLPVVDEQAIEDFLAEGGEAEAPPAEDDFSDIFDQL